MMIKELLTELKYKKEAEKRWKQGQVTGEECRDTVSSYKNWVRKEAKAHLELNLMGAWRVTERILQVHQQERDTAELDKESNEGYGKGAQWLLHV